MLKLGIHAEGIKELFGSGIPGFQGDLSYNDFQAIFNVVSVKLRLKGKIVTIILWCVQSLFVWVTCMLCLFQLKNWQILPNDKPVLSAFTRASGQEWFRANLNKDFIQSIIGVKQ